MSSSTIFQIITMVAAAALVGLLFANRAWILARVTSIRGFSGEVRAELRKVSWPSREEVVNSTLMVGVLVFFTVLVIGFADYIFTELVAAVFKFK